MVKITLLKDELLGFVRFCDDGWRKRAVGTSIKEKPSIVSLRYTKKR